MGHPYAAKKAAAAHGVKNIENAVYAHIQAMRALGKTRVNTVDIAKALNLSLSEVEKTISALRHKGVKIANG
jgi:Mn-dependent DtxR family transcriptional regulator